MQLTRYTHSCVRLESGGRVVVIDPGIWSEPEALDGADAVLITHEHADHVDIARLRHLDAPIYSPIGSNIPDLDTRTFPIGSTFEVAGFGIETVGGRHGSVIRDLPRCVNAGYFVDRVFYHPGDSLHIPELPVETVLVPIQASWLKIADIISFVNQIAPRLTIGGHEAQLSLRGLAAANGWLLSECASYRWLEPGQTIDLGAAEDQRQPATLP